MRDKIVERHPLAGAYNSMMQMDAWQDLVAYAKREGEMSMQKMDSKAAADLSLGEVCEERGMRKGILKVIQHAEFCREGV